MDHVVLFREVETEIYSFLIADLELSFLLSLLVFPLPSILLFIRVLKPESKKSIGSYDFLSCLVFDSNMRLKFILSPECYIALLFAIIIWTEVMRFREMILQAWVRRVVYVLVEVWAKMACEMLPAQVIEEDLVIEEVFEAEIAPWVRQNLSLFLCTWISIVNMISDISNVVEPLLSDEN